MNSEGPSLSKYEINLCNFIYGSSVLYGFYHVFLLSSTLETSKSYLEDSWLFGYKRDATELLWDTSRAMIALLIPALIIHLIISEYIRSTFKEVLPLFHITITNIFLYWMYGVSGISIAFLIVFLYIILLALRSYWIIIIFNVTTIIFMDYYMENLQEFWFEREQLSIFATVYFPISLGWIQLKCVSFSFDILAKPSFTLDYKTITYILGYCYYFPLYFLGPFNTYEDYEKAVNKSYMKWTMKQINAFIREVLRFIGWAIILDVTLHFLYIHELEFYLKQIKQMGAWYLNGILYTAVMFFGIKYIVYYGLAGTFSRAEGLSKTPPPPIGICCIHCSIYNWRKFDVGFYIFIKNYVYLPILNKSTSKFRKHLALTLSFCYVYIWHGKSRDIMLWSLFNYCQVAIENILYRVGKNKRFKDWLNDNFSKENIIRLTALYYSPLHITALLINSLLYSTYGLYSGEIYILQFFEVYYLPLAAHFYPVDNAYHPLTRAEYGLRSSETYINRIKMSANGNWALIGTTLLISYCHCIKIVNNVGREKTEIRDKENE